MKEKTKNQKSKQKEQHSTNTNLGGAMGKVSTNGVGIYDLEGSFYDVQLSDMEKVHLHSLGFGEVIDTSSSYVAGAFYENPKDYLGTCRFSLEEISFDFGLIKLTILSKDKTVKIAQLYGMSKGFGEAFVKNKKGHLHIKPSEHTNKVKFIGDSSIDKISFELDDHIVTEDQPFDGIHADLINDKSNELEIDVKAGRKGSKDCAKFFNNSVGNSNDYMMHTDGGSSKPDELNFAFTGTLIINDQAFEISLGQGHHYNENNWHLASYELKPTSHHKSGNLGDFHISTSGSYTFHVKVK